MRPGPVKRTSFRKEKGGSGSSGPSLGGTNGDDSFAEDGPAAACAMAEREEGGGRVWQEKPLPKGQTDGKQRTNGDRTFILEGPVRCCPLKPHTPSEQVRPPHPTLPSTLPLPAAHPCTPCARGLTEHSEHRGSVPELSAKRTSHAESTPPPPPAPDRPIHGAPSDLPTPLCPVSAGLQPGSCLPLSRVGSAPRPPLSGQAPADTPAAAEAASEPAAAAAAAAAAIVDPQAEERRVRRDRGYAKRVLAVVTHLAVSREGVEGGITSGSSLWRRTSRPGPTSSPKRSKASCSPSSVEIESSSNSISQSERITCRCGQTGED